MAAVIQLNGHIQRAVDSHFKNQLELETVIGNSSSEWIQDRVAVLLDR